MRAGHRHGAYSGIIKSPPSRSESNSEKPPRCKLSNRHLKRFHCKNQSKDWKRHSSFLKSSHDKYNSHSEWESEKEIRLTHKRNSHQSGVLNSRREKESSSDRHKGIRHRCDRELLVRPTLLTISWKPWTIARTDKSSQYDYEALEHRLVGQVAPSTGEVAGFPFIRPKFSNQFSIGV